MVGRWHSEHRAAPEKCCVHVELSAKSEAFGSVPPAKVFVIGALDFRVHAVLKRARHEGSLLPHPRCRSRRAQRHCHCALVGLQGRGCGRIGTIRQLVQRLPSRKVFANDVRDAAREQVESMGAQFIAVDAQGIAGWAPSSARTQGLLAMMCAVSRRGSRRVRHRGGPGLV